MLGPLRAAILRSLQEPLANGYFPFGLSAALATVATAVGSAVDSWLLPMALFLGVLLFFALLAYVGDNRRPTTESPYGSSVLIWLVVGPLWLHISGLLAAGKLWALLPLGLATVLLWPWFTVRWLLIPLSAARLARWVARLCTVRLRQDRHGGATLAAAWAMLHKPQGPARLDWLERQLHQAEDLRGGGQVAHGLLWALRGDDDRARQTLHAVLEMDPLAVPALAEQVATAWLAADAAERGDWPLVRTLGYRPKGPRFGCTRLLGAVAARLCGDPAAVRALGQDPRGASDHLLRWRWLLASRRRALWPLLVRALQTPRGAPLPPPALARPLEKLEPLPMPPVQLPLDAALALHARTLGRYPLFLHDRDLHALATAWDQAATSPETRHLALRRGLVLGVDGEATLARLYHGLEPDLAVLARQARVPLEAAVLQTDHAPSPLLLASARQLRELLLKELEEAAGTLKQRIDAGRTLPIIDECREWETLRSQYEQAVRLGGPRLRREIWPTYFRALCQHEVWLFNERGARVLSNTISRYLLAQAIELEDPERIELQRKNVACGV